MQTNSHKPATYGFFTHLLHRRRPPEGEAAPIWSGSAQAVARASPYSDVPSNGKLSNEMIRAAGQFSQIALGRYDDPGMPAISRGRPKTEWQAAQMLFAAVLDGSDGPKGCSRTDADYLKSLQHRAAEMPALVKLLSRQRQVSREFKNEFVVAGDLAARALTLLAQAPSTAPLQTFFLSALLGLPPAVAMSTDPAQGKTARDLAGYLRRGVGNGPVVDRQAQVDAGQAAVSAAHDAGLIGKPLADAVNDAFVALVPQERPLLDVRPDRFTDFGISRFSSDPQLNRSARGDGIGLTFRNGRFGARWAAEDSNPVVENRQRMRPSRAAYGTPSAVAAAPVAASSSAGHRAHMKTVIRDTWSHWTGRRAQQGIDGPSAQPSMVESNEVRAAIAARVGTAAPAKMESSSRGPATRTPASSFADRVASGPTVLSPGDATFIKRAPVPVT